MGRNGVSKRKPKKTKSGSSDSINHGSSNAQPGQSPSSVQSLVNSRNAPLNRGATNPSTGSNKKNRQGR
jgi:hypothetical protein